jgi:hypothetical protein
VHQNKLYFMSNINTQLDAAKVKAKVVFRRIAWIALILGIVSAAGYYFARTYTVSDGNRSGLLFKISKKGIVFKTYEGQLHLGGSIQMSSQSVWDFSAKNEAVYQQLQKYEGKNVSCHYRELVNPFAWQGDTKYIVDSVTPVQ